MEKNNLACLFSSAIGIDLGRGKHVPKHDHSVKNSVVLELNDSDRDYKFKEASSQYKTNDESVNSLDEIYAKAKNDSEYDTDSILTL